MSVTPESKGIQFRRGFPLGTTTAQFEFWPTVKGETVTPTSGVDITIYSAAAVELVAETAMSGSADGPYTYILDISTTATYALGRGYYARYRFTSASVIHPDEQEFGIYTKVPVGRVAQQDFAETVYDAGDYEGDRTNNHGLLIVEAWNQTLTDLADFRDPASGAALDPYTLTSDEMYAPHHAHCCVLLALELKNQEGDRFDGIYQHWLGRYNDKLTSIETDTQRRWNEDSAVIESETDEGATIGSQMKTYGLDSTQSNSSTRRRVRQQPPVDWQTRW